MPQELTIDKDCWTSFHPRFRSVLNIPTDLRWYFWILYIFLKLQFIQTQLPDDFLDFLISKPVEIIEQSVMELPKLSLPVGSKSDHSGLPGKFVVSERKVLKDELHFLRVFVKHLLE